MKTINSRNKGAAAERELTGIIQDWTGVKLIRNLEQSRSGGHDLIVHPDETGGMADTFRLLAIECKRYGSVTNGLIKQWWRQSVDQAEKGGLKPVLAYRADRQNWQAVIPLYLINPSMTQTNSHDYTATLSIPALCSVIREVGQWT